jgi:hypothetical protein
MQDRRRQFDEIFLQRTAGPYIRVKLRNTQHEQMSSALPSTADVGLARKGVTQIDGVVAFDRLLKM